MIGKQENTHTHIYNAFLTCAWVRTMYDIMFRPNYAVALSIPCVQSRKNSLVLCVCVLRAGGEYGDWKT